MLCFVVLNQNSCVPKKVTWNAAALAHTLKDAKSYGFSFQETAPFNWAAFTKKRADYVKRLNGIYAKNLDNDHVEWLHGRATFQDRNTVTVRLDDGSTQTIKAKNTLIAVGGHPKKMNIPGAELGISSDGFFELEKQPKKAALVGAGYIAVEMAGMFKHLGTETHLFIRQDKFLRPFDPMLQDKIMAEYEHQGLVIHKNSSQSKVEDIGSGMKRIYYKDSNGEGTLDVDCLLWAIGRAPEIDDFGLDKTGVRLAESGHIAVDDYQRTNVDNIFALGDVCDRGFELTPVAIAAGRKLSDRLFGGKADAHLEYSNIPSAVFAHPEAGTIGMTEPQAREKYGDKVKVYNSSFTDMYYAMMEPDEKGPTSYKLVCAGPDEKVVGLHIMGRGSSEVLQGFGKSDEAFNNMCLFRADEEFHRCGHQDGRDEGRLRLGSCDTSHCCRGAGYAEIDEKWEQFYYTSPSQLFLRIQVASTCANLASCVMLDRVLRRYDTLHLLDENK